MKGAVAGPHMLAEWVTKALKNMAAGYPRAAELCAAQAGKVARELGRPNPFDDSQPRLFNAAAAAMAGTGPVRDPRRPVSKMPARPATHAAHVAAKIAAAEAKESDE
ncbi:MAG: hypothetical protein HQL42_13185 [Alphaproteobacteria bacterium]|nr:hypothetical protein [Alphaproteobacteria bacterium]